MTFAFPNARTHDLFDDFLSAIDTSAKRVLGALAWTYSGDGSVTGGTAAAGATGNVGNIHLNSGDVDTDATALFLGNAANGGIIHPDDVLSFEFRVRPSAIAHLKFVLGLGSNVANDTLGADAVGFYMSSAGALHAFTRSSSAETDVDLGVTLDASHWYRLYVDRGSAGWRFYAFDQTGEAVAAEGITTNLPAQPLVPGVYAVCDGATSGNHLKIDAFGLRLQDGIRL